MDLSTLNISTGQNVLLLWGSAAPPAAMTSTVDSLTQMVGDAGKVQVENIQRLAMCKQKFL